jgi:2-keto-4-pentenoate hydratase/2-oxohepta-3-ene-1,7-dioic acid hydratase in catechol pathway
MREDAYRLASYADEDGSVHAGAVVGERIFDAAQAVGASEGRDADWARSVMGILEHWAQANPRLRALARAARSASGAPEGRPLSRVKLLPPVMYPGTVFCAGANYRDHVQEMSRALHLPPEPDPHELGLNPWHFIKASAPCVRPTGARIPLPRYARCVDWEAEIALVIGKPCHEVKPAAALEHVAGLTIVNDLSARDHLRREKVAPDSPFRFDWVSQKCFDGALPMGPWITPLEDFEALDRLGIKLWVNDELMQDSSSANLIFSFAEQVAHLSSRLTLRPGDVIATGTPAGCGAARGRFLRPGDRVRIWVEGIGELHSEFCA